MTERTETMQGPVSSAITQLMQHMEIAMWARGVDPETTTEVINLLMFGHPYGASNGGTVKGIPGWANEMAGKLLDVTDRSVAARRKEHGVPGREGFSGDVRLVVLALVRLALQQEPDTFDQVLARGSSE